MRKIIFSAFFSASVTGIFNRDKFKNDKYRYRDNFSDIDKIIRYVVKIVSA